MRRLKTIGGLALSCALLAGCGRSVPVSAAVEQTAQEVSAAATPAPTATPVPTATPAPTPTPIPVGLTDAEAEILETFCTAQEQGFSVCLIDLKSGDTYSTGEGSVYYMASLLKAPYALWLCMGADDGNLDLDTELLNTRQGGLAGGALTAYDQSATIPAREALRAMLAFSDNDATELLAQQWPASSEMGFPIFLKALGFSQAELCSITPEDGIAGYATVTELASCMERIYRYMESDAPHAALLRECFTAAVHQALYVPQEIEAAKKYGSWDYAFHDAAIVYAENPYVLCCMTDQGDADVDFPELPTAAMQQLGRLAYQVTNES